MKNLLHCNGRFFSAKIQDDKVTGRIRVENERVYLCQDKKNGASCEDKLGYKYSWIVDDGSEEKLASNNVSCFKLTLLTAEEIEKYKDWKVRDKIRMDDDKIFEVIFQSGELVVLKDVETGKASANYTCDELYNMGYRFFQPEMEEKEITELTMDEIAEKFGLPVDKIRVKKD